MRKKIADTTFYRRSEDVLDLPPIMHEELAFELNPAEARVYRDLEKDFCSLLRDKTVTPANAMVGALRLLQCCGGYITPDGEKIGVQIADETPSKTARFVEWLEDLPEREPLVVFCRFRADIAAARKAIESTGRTTSELSGTMNDLAQWQAGKTDALVAQIVSGGIGIDLTRASFGVFYSIGHSLSEWLQAIARLHRPGQTKHTSFYSLVATLPHNRLTVEGRVYAALRDRKDVVSELVSLYRDFDPRRPVGSSG
jgi:superfamily II DNA or RNA helicase